MKYPFEATISEIEAAPETFVSAVFSSLVSDFLTLPRGDGFVEYADFESGYEALKKATDGFSLLARPSVMKAVLEVPIAFVVLRAMLGFTPPELAYVAAPRCGSPLTQGFARGLDRKIRMAPLCPLRANPESSKRIEAMVATACDLLEQGCPEAPADQIDRLRKADTVGGLAAVRTMAAIGAPYALVLYERFLGRPFAGHRDSVSGLVGDGLEDAIEEQLAKAGISYRKTRRAERFPGFDQAPDFMIPSEFNPKTVIEAKLTEDDGTARDKVTRIQHLHSLSIAGQPAGCCKFEVVACIAGRGFGVRREDMKKLLLATHGKVFTPRTLDRLVECTELKNFRTR
jgi:hypothetical protein